MDFPHRTNCTHENPTKESNGKWEKKRKMNGGEAFHMQIAF